MKIDLVIFDCDGVLIDSEIISAQMLVTELARLGQGNRVWVWVVALKSFDMEFRHRTRRGAPFGHDMFSYFTHGFPNAIALAAGGAD